MDKSLFATRLKALRKQKKMKQAELADAIGVRQTAVSQWELKKTYPKKIDYYIKLAEILGCSMDYLMGLETATDKIVQVTERVYPDEMFIGGKKRDAAEVFSMRDSGMMLDEIAEHFGVSRQCIHQKHKTYMKKFKTVYPKVSEKMLEHRIIPRDLSLLTGIALQRLKQILSGYGLPSMREAKIIKNALLMDEPIEEIFIERGDQKDDAQAQ